MTDDYTPSGWGTGVIADSSDGRPNEGNEYKSWNRWRQGEDQAPPAAARVAQGAQAAPDEDAGSEDVDSPPARQGEVSEEPVADNGYVPMRRSSNTKRRRGRRGGGRHRLNERGGSRGRSRGTRRKAKESKVAPGPVAESKVASEPVADERPAPAPEPVRDRQPEPQNEVASEPRQDPSEPRRDAGSLARNEVVAELRTLTASDSGIERDQMPRRRRAPEMRQIEPTKAIDDVIADARGGEETDEAKTEPRKKARRARVVETDLVPRRSRVRLSTKLLLLAVVVLSAATAAALLLRAGDSSEGSGAPNGAGAGESVTTTLIAGTDAPGEEAKWLTLLSYDRNTKEGAVVYVPAHTAVEVPGRGLQGIGDSLNDGDIELLVLSAKSLLNVEIDNYLEVTPEDAEALVSGVGPLTVEVPSEVLIGAGKGTARLLFPQGSQELTPDQVAQLLFTTGLESDELDLGPRHLAVWDALFDAYEENPGQLVTALSSAGDVGRSDADMSEYTEVIGSIAEAGSQARNLSMLPVAPVSVGDSELYAIDEVELGEFMRTTAHAEAPSHDAVRVQVLNGNGYPGVGQEVADRLLADGFRVVLSGNARSLNEGTTLIVTYDASPEGLELAEQARALIGVGEVQVSRLDQGIVDLTIVVGKDFLRKL